MTDLKQEKEKLLEKAETWLANKPFYIWWLSYSGVVALLFLIFKIAMKVITGVWWFPVLIILVTGLVWSNMTYSSKKEKGN